MIRLWRPLTLPLRLYIRRFPVQKGKGLISRHILAPLLPAEPHTFDLRLPGDSVVQLQYREAIGISALVFGSFELAEIMYLAHVLSPGDVAIDVGANVGLYSLPMSRAVADDGMVIAIEPLPSNAARLRYHLTLNARRNVRVHEEAAGGEEGTVTLHVGEDAAYASLERPDSPVRSMPVQCRPLDKIWMQYGRPMVKVIKVDVEGAELSVLEGAQELLASCRPILLVEANTSPRLARLRSWCELRGYRQIQPPGFKPWNHIFYVPSAHRS